MFGTLKVKAQFATGAGAAEIGKFICGDPIAGLTYINDAGSVRYGEPSGWSVHYTHASYVILKAPCVDVLGGFKYVKISPTTAGMNLQTMSGITTAATPVPIDITPSSVGGTNTTVNATGGSLITVFATPEMLLFYHPLGSAVGSFEFERDSPLCGDGGRGNTFFVGMTSGSGSAMLKGSRIKAVGADGDSINPDLTLTPASIGAGVRDLGEIQYRSMIRPLVLHGGCALGRPVGVVMVSSDCAHGDVVVDQAGVEYSVVSLNGGLRLAVVRK